MKKHELKTDPAVFEAVATGAKTHEIRFNDRDFAVGDTLHLRETTATGAEIAHNNAALQYTGREVLRQVSHIQTGYGLADGWVILSFHTQAHNAGCLMNAMAGFLRGATFHSEKDATRARFLADQFEAQHSGALRSTIDSPFFRGLLTDWWAKAASEDHDAAASALRVLVQHIDQAGPTIAAQLSGNSGLLPHGLMFRGYSDEDEQFGETILNYMRSRSEIGTDDLNVGDVIEVTAMWTQDQKWQVTCAGNPFEVVRISPEVPT